MANIIQCNPLFFFRRKTLKSLDNCKLQSFALAKIVYYAIQVTHSIHLCMFGQPIICPVLCRGKYAVLRTCDSKFKKTFIFLMGTYRISANSFRGTCDLWSQYIRCGNYSRAETIRGNTVSTLW